MRLIKVLFAIVCYAIGFGTILYYADFFTGFFVPKSINTGNPDSFIGAFVTNLALLCIFGLQHSVMARPTFKQRIQKIVPTSLTRSIYILLSSVCLGVLILFWQPIPLVIYDFKETIIGTVLLNLYYFGWVIGLLSTFEIDHFQLFGVRQAMYPNAVEKNDLKTPFFYRIVRHPIYLGWILIHWMTPMLTVGHLILAVGITAYILIALRYEERDLIRKHRKQYLDYKKFTPQLNPLLYPFKKKPKVIQVSKILGVIAVLYASVWAMNYISWINHELRMMKSDDPQIWAEEIAKLSRENHEFHKKKSSVLFVGSSSFRFWKKMTEDLDPIKTINNGFGGAKIEDVRYYDDELIYQYQPDHLVFYLGSNDISGSENDKTPDELVNDYKKLLNDVHQRLPDCHLYVISITPTIARWDVWPKVKSANSRIKQYSEILDWVTFIDLEDVFLNSEGEPIWSYYKWDGTHLNPKGYELWANAIKRAMHRGGWTISTQ